MPSRVGPEFPAHRRIRDHETDGIGDLLGLDEPAELGVFQYELVNKLFAQGAYHGGIGKPRMDHTATHAVKGRFFG